MKKGKTIYKAKKKSEKTFKLDLLKEMIDKQNKLILETPRGEHMVRMNLPILGKYSSRDSSSSKDAKLNAHGLILSPTYTDPTILMYTIIMKKVDFFKSVLYKQLKFISKEKQQKSISKEEFNPIIYQGLNKISILDLSIECCSNDCFDIILEFFNNNNIPYNEADTINLAARYNNKYAVQRLLQENQTILQFVKDMVEKENKKKEAERKSKNDNKAKPESKNEMEDQTKNELSSNIDNKSKQESKNEMEDQAKNELSSNTDNKAKPESENEMEDQISKESEQENKIKDENVNKMAKNEQKSETADEPGNKKEIELENQAKEINNSDSQAEDKQKNKQENEANDKKKKYNNTFKEIYALIKKGVLNNYSKGKKLNDAGSKITDDASLNEYSISVISKEDHQNKENDEQREEICSYDGCTNAADRKCAICLKFFCTDHIDIHNCHA